MTIRRIAAALVSVASTAALLVGSGPAVSAQAASEVDSAEVDSSFRYVALGDSYTAAPLVPDIIFANGCFQSTRNYPHVVASALAVADFVDASCSGAQTKDVFESQRPGVGPQLNAVTPDTDLVTVSIGGNDFNVFGTLVGFCPTLQPTAASDAPCRDAMRDDGQDRLLAAVAVTEQRVDAVVAAVKQRAPEAQVVVVGYPQILPRQGTCPALMPMAAGDYRYANQVNERLTLALRHAAARHQADYADVWGASQGHDICSDDPWINGQVADPARAQQFHPFANEQAAVAGLVVAEVNAN